MASKEEIDSSAKRLLHRLSQIEESKRKIEKSMMIASNGSVDDDVPDMSSNEYRQQLDLIRRALLTTQENARLKQEKLEWEARSKQEKLEKEARLKQEELEEEARLKHEKLVEEARLKQKKLEEEAAQKQEEAALIQKKLEEEVLSLRNELSSMEKDKRAKMELMKERDALKKSLSNAMFWAEKAVYVGW